MKNHLTIVLTGGGSGGHITPLLSLAHELKKQEPQCRIIYIGQKGEKLENSLRERYQVFDESRYVAAGKFRRYHGESLLAHLTDWRTLYLNFVDFFKVLAGTWQARKLLASLKPAAVFSKGGFVSVPVGLAARSLGIPIVTHDSDAIAGLANRIIGRYATVKTTGMPYRPGESHDERVRYVGIPLDERIRQVTPKLQARYKKEIELPADSQVLLISGGGLGSQSLNQKIIQITPKLLEDMPKLRIIHFTGESNLKKCVDEYNESAATYIDRVKPLGFSSDYFMYSGAADLVVARAGATTIAELALQKKAVLLIPAEHLTGGHQIKNAQILEEAEAAKIVSSNITPEELRIQITLLLKDASKRRKLADNLGMMAKADAASELARIIIASAAREKSPSDDE